MTNITYNKYNPHILDITYVHTLLIDLDTMKYSSIS